MSMLVSGTQRTSRCFPILISNCSVLHTRLYHCDDSILCGLLIKGTAFERNSPCGNEKANHIPFFLLVFQKLLQTPTTYAQIGELTANEIHSLISKTADAYYEASNLSPVATSAAYHARFLQSLLANDIFQSRRPDVKPGGRNDNGMPIDPRLQSMSSLFYKPFETRKYSRFTSCMLLSI